MRDRIIIPRDHKIPNLIEGGYIDHTHEGEAHYLKDQAIPLYKKNTEGKLEHLADVEIRKEIYEKTEEGVKTIIHYRPLKIIKREK